MCGYADNDVRLRSMFCLSGLPPLCYVLRYSFALVTQGSMGALKPIARSLDKTNG